MDMALKEYWDRERTLEEFRLFVSKYKTFSATILSVMNPHLYHLNFFHFGSYHRARSLIEKQLSSDEIESFKEYWNKKRKEGETFLKIYRESKSNLKQISIDDAVKTAKQFPEFLNCKTKAEVRLFAIRAFSDYNIELKKLEVKLWDELARQRRIELTGINGDIIDALEYSASGLYGALGEDLFMIYARRKNWEYYKTSDFLLSIKNGKPIDELTYYEYGDLVKPLLSLCFEKIEHHHRGPVEELKRGIPDFIVWERYQFQKRPFFVEVKSNQSTLSEQQKELFISLSKLTKVYIFRINIPNVIFKVDFKEFI